MQIMMQTLCEWMQMGKDPVRSRIAPISGPKMMTKIALPTMCHPKAAGSFSSDEYSDTVSVKLLRAMPRKKPAMHSQAIIDVRSVWCATTGMKRGKLSQSCWQARRGTSYLIELSQRKKSPPWTPSAWKLSFCRKSVERWLGQGCRWERKWTDSKRCRPSSIQGSLRRKASPSWSSSRRRRKSTGQTECWGKFHPWASRCPSGRRSVSKKIPSLAPASPARGQFWWSPGTRAFVWSPPCSF